jgi:Na+-driven multidrug efflux pump
LKITFACYAETLCFEAYTYLSSLTYDQAQISAFVSFMNVMGIVYNGGFCIGNVLRTNVGNLLGSRKFDQAKNVYWFYVFIMSCVGVIGGGLMYWFRMSIAGVYTGLEDVSGLLGQLIGIYSLALIPEFILGMNNTVMRITGNVAKMIIYL